MAGDRINAQTCVAQFQDQNPAWGGIGDVDAVATEDLGESLRGVAAERVREEVAGLRDMRNIDAARQTG